MTGRLFTPRCSVALPILVAGAIAATATAQTSIITLSNGTRLHATIVEQTSDTIRINDPVLGVLSVPRSSVVAIVDPSAPPPAPAAPADPAPAPAPAPAAETAAAPASTGGLSFLRGWGWDAEIGMNGSDGNTDQFNLRAGLNGTRETERLSTTLRFNYNYATTDGTKNEERFLSKLRNDWKFIDSPWRVFAEGEVEIDDFQDWNWRWSAFGGVGYAFIDNDRTLLLGRVGIGFNQFVGGENDDVSPEALLGLQFNHKFTDRQSFESEATFYPNLDDTGEYRVVARAAYSILVDPELNMSLKLGVENRYNSDPGGVAKKNDLDYFLALVWSF
jgi:putative salt-induced outer membrane protein YdiY